MLQLGTNWTTWLYFGRLISFERSVTKWTQACGKRMDILATPVPVSELVALTPVIECIAPAPPVTSSSPSQPSRPAFTSFLERLTEQVVPAPFPQGVREVVPASGSELTTAVVADDSAPDVELDELDAALVERTAQKSSLQTKRRPIQPESQPPKLRWRAGTKGELWTVYAMAPLGVRGGIQELDTWSWTVLWPGSTSSICWGTSSMCTKFCSWQARRAVLYMIGNQWPVWCLPCCEAVLHLSCGAVDFAASKFNWPIFRIKWRGLGKRSRLTACTLPVGTMRHLGSKFKAIYFIYSGIEYDWWPQRHSCLHACTKRFRCTGVSSQQVSFMKVNVNIRKDVYATVVLSNSTTMFLWTGEPCVSCQISLNWRRRSWMKILISLFPAGVFAQSALCTFLDNDALVDETILMSRHDLHWHPSFPPHEMFIYSNWRNSNLVGELADVSSQMSVTQWTQACDTMSKSEFLYSSHEWRSSILSCWEHGTVLQIVFITRLRLYWRPWGPRSTTCVSCAFLEVEHLSQSVGCAENKLKSFLSMLDYVWMGYLLLILEKLWLRFSFNSQQCPTQA